MTENLRNLTTCTDGSDYGRRVERPSSEVRAHAPEVTAVFENLPERCCDFIRGAGMITGCVAWLTNTLILQELSNVPQVSVIVQKEDFLRPDNPRQFKPELRRLYNNLSALGLGRNWVPGVNSLSTCCEMPGDYCAVKCMGVVNRGQRLAVPRMHHKFLVRYVYKHPENLEAGGVCPDSSGAYWCCGCPVPVAVWTGSFNMTYNGSQSLENAVVIYDPSIAQRYHDEWAWVFSLAEPLNWEHEWVEPELRLGT